MGNSSHPEISSAFTVTRRFPVIGTDPDRIGQATAALDGVESVARANNGTDVSVRYDASRVGYGDIEQCLGQAGIALRHGYWTDLKAAWFRFVDENARANATRKAGSCCNRPPSAPN